MLVRFIILLLFLGHLNAVAAIHKGIDCRDTENRELVCMACNIFHESGVEDVMGKIAVGQVVLNRVKSRHYPNSVCDVVFEDLQFSWANTDGPHKTGKGSRWHKSMEVAYGLLLKTGHRYGYYGLDLTDCATNYHASWMKKFPDWPNLRKTVQIGQHIFYRPKRGQCVWDN